MSLEALIRHNTAEMNKIVSVLELSLQHRNEDLTQLKHVLSVRNSEINTLKGVLASTQRRNWILQHETEREQRAREKVEMEKKDLKMVVESLKRKNNNSEDLNLGNSNETLVNSFKFLQKKYQEGLEDVEKLEDDYAMLKEKHSLSKVII